VIPGSSLLEPFWLAVAAHLWQTTLVLVPLFALGSAMRGAPARLVNVLWWTGLAKFFLPLPVLGPLGERTLAPLMSEIFVSGDPSATLSVWLGKASFILDPSILVAHARSHPGVGPGFYGILTVLWTLGALCFGLRWIRQRPPAALRRAIPIGESDAWVSGRLQRALSGTGIPGSAIRVSRAVSIPSLIGLVRPRIVVSETMIRNLNTGELRAILLHENEHRRRMDPLRLIVQRCALTLFFFYPLLWPLLSRLKASGEMACDEAAVSAGIRPAVYAQALARTLRIGLLPIGSPVALGSGAPSLIRRRFLRLDEHARYVTMTRHRLALCLGIALVVSLSFLPLVPLATPEAKHRLTLPALIPGSYVLPEYPEDARSAGVEGKILIDVLVSAIGEPVEVELQRGVIDYPSLGESAVEAVGQWTFEPATRDGRAVDLRITIPVMFTLNG